jgi:hypothetical protein
VVCGSRPPRELGELAHSSEGRFLHYFLKGAASSNGEDFSRSDDPVTPQAASGEPHARLRFRLGQLK